MALPASGTISLAQMNTEFGLGYSFNAYRGAWKSTVPTTGPISFSQMYNARQKIYEYGGYQASYRMWYNQSTTKTIIYWYGTVIYNSSYLGGVGTTYYSGGYYYYPGTFAYASGAHADINRFY